MNWLLNLEKGLMIIMQQINDVGYEKRLEDIKNRYGNDSDVYKKCEKLVSIIRD